jgi:rhodanese-related sulfurtransferase
MEASGGQAAIDGLLEHARARYRRVTAAEAAEAAEHGAVIVDIRSEEQRGRDGLVPGALHVQRNVLEWRADPTSGSRDEAIVSRRGSLIVMCAQGYQSSLAAATLLDLGLEDATDMVDGFEGWVAAGLPVERRS